MHHVILRGIARRAIFRDDGDGARLLDRLAVRLGESRPVCYSWALIPNREMPASSALPLRMAGHRLPPLDLLFQPVTQFHFSPFGIIMGLQAGPEFHGGAEAAGHAQGAVGAEAQNQRATPKRCAMTDDPSIKAVFPPKKIPAFPAALKRENLQPVFRFHQSLPGYQATPLHCLPALARHLGIRNIYVKDESRRFGLNAFKALGATWAVAGILCAKLGRPLADTDFPALKQAASHVGDMVFVTATDGNHGRGLAWAAAQLGCRAVVYMPAGSAASRVRAIEKEGARVWVTDRNYDGAVRLAAAAARENGWHLVQDTAFEGYEQVPDWILQGYTTMAREVLEQLGDRELALPTHLFLQAGVGSMAASVL
jgi:hypothetical protein